MAWGIDNCEVIFGGLELPKGDIDGNSTFSLSLELVQDPGVLEGGLSHFLGFLLELFDGSLVDSTAFVDQMSSGGGLSRIDVANNDDVDVSLLLSHFL